jgi:hypothetical protein
MNPEKWRYFRVAFVAFALVASVAIYEHGGFSSMGLGGLAILLLAFAAVALAVYLFVKDEPEDPGFH